MIFCGKKIDSRVSQQELRKIFEPLVAMPAPEASTLEESRERFLEQNPHVTLAPSHLLSDLVEKGYINHTHLWDELPDGYPYVYFAADLVPFKGESSGYTALYSDDDGEPACVVLPQDEKHEPGAASYFFAVIRQNAEDGEGEEE